MEQFTFPTSNFDAVLFDMDGVVTDTVAAHAARRGGAYSMNISRSAPAAPARRSASSIRSGTITNMSMASRAMTEIAPCLARHYATPG